MQKSLYNLKLLITIYYLIPHTSFGSHIYWFAVQGFCWEPYISQSYFCTVGWKSHICYAMVVDSRGFTKGAAIATNGDVLRRGRRERRGDGIWWYTSSAKRWYSFLINLQFSCVKILLYVWGLQYCIYDIGEVMPCCSRFRGLCMCYS